LRHRDGPGPDRRDRVVPVVTTGLHCGRWGTSDITPEEVVVPVVTTGLHCGGLGRAGRRQNRAGRPRRHDGAPLRQGGCQVGAVGSLEVVPVVTTGLHCGHRGGAKSRPASSVVPVVTTGLHCGAVVAALLGTGGTGRPRRHDGAPLRRLVEPVDARGQGVSSPSSRRGSIAASASPTAGTSNNVVVPVVTTGLHCGAMLTDEATRQGIVVPVVTTGLHCGVMDAAATRRLGVRRPRRHDGAPLRRRPDRNVVRRAGARSSPSSRRGSIAAMESPHEHLA